MISSRSTWMGGGITLTTSPIYASVADVTRNFYKLAGSTVFLGIVDILFSRQQQVTLLLSCGFLIIIASSNNTQLLQLLLLICYYIFYILFLYYYYCYYNSTLHLNVTHKDVKQSTLEINLNIFYALCLMNEH